jgi:hypothetical protein
MLTRTQRRFGRAALRAAVIGMAATALGGGIATTANAAEPTGARDVDWSNASLELTEIDSRCPGGPLTFATGYAEVDTGARFPSQFFQGVVKYGDVNRDGREDAVLSITCNPNSNETAALTATYAYSVENGAPALIGAVTVPPVTPESYEVRGGTVAVKARPDRDAASKPLNFRFRWDGKAFQERSGKAAYVYSWGTEQLAMPFKADAVPMRGDGSEPRPCPKATVDFDNYGDHYSRRGEVHTAADFVYGINVTAFGDVNRDGVTDALVEISCFDGTVFNLPNSWNYVYTIKNGKAVPLSYLTASESVHGSTGIRAVTLAPGKVTLKQDVGTSDVQADRTFRWTHAGLKAQQPLPGYPNVDVAP